MVLLNGQRNMSASLKISLFIMFLVFFQPSHSENCKPCVQTELIQLAITGRDSLKGFNKEPQRVRNHDFNAWIGQQRMNGQKISGVKYVEASSQAEFKKALQELKGTCQKVSILSIDAHGDSGKIKLGNDDKPENQISFDQEELFKELKQYQCVMAPNAAIVAGSCHSGLGCHGDFLLMSLAKALLPKGGTVAMSEDFVFGSFFGVNSPMPYMGNIKMLMVGRDFRNPLWSSASEDNCQKQAQETLKLREQNASRYSEIIRSAEERKCSKIEEIKGYERIEQDKIAKCKEFLSSNNSTFSSRNFPTTEQEERKFYSQVSKYAFCGEWQTGESLLPRLFSAWSSLCGSKDASPSPNNSGTNQSKMGVR